MTMQAVRDKRDELYKTDGLAADVYSCFLRQPSQIGPNSSQLERLNLKNPKHREIYLGAVRREVDILKERSGFRQHEAIEKHYEAAKELLFQQ